MCKPSCIDVSSIFAYPGPVLLLKSNSLILNMSTNMAGKYGKGLKLVQIAGSLGTQRVGNTTRCTWRLEGT